MARDYDGPIAFSAGFRPFFVGCGAWAVIAMVVWLGALSAYSVLPDHVAPVEWHFNELLFGVIGAALAGFVLTAVPNWTGQLPISGVRLIVLFALWCGGRVASILGTELGVRAVAIIDSAFFIVLFLVILREIFRGKNWRNLPVAGAVGTFGVAHILFYLEAMGALSISGASERLALAALGCLLTLIGGRIVPSFTRNWLRQRQQEGGVSAALGPIDKLTILVTVVALLSWVIFPSHPASGYGLIVAGLLNALRLARWRGWRTLPEPLLLILHIGYGWLALSLVLLGGSVLDEFVSEADALHSLTVGAAGTMILAVMSRAILGHTGHHLRADWTTVLVYCSINVAALSRLGVMIRPDWSMDLYLLSGGAWILAFCLFLWRYAPIAIGR